MPTREGVRQHLLAHLTYGFEWLLWAGHCAGETPFPLFCTNSHVMGNDFAACCFVVPSKRSYSHDAIDIQRGIERHTLDW
jgi:hypothetical protein